MGKKLPRSKNVGKKIKKEDTFLKCGTFWDIILSTMDTDDLSIPTYNGIIIEAEKYNHDLTLQFGVLAAQCKDDDDYLNNAEEIIKTWLADKDFDVIADDIFFGVQVDLSEFRKVLEKLLSNINEIRKTPMGEREFEDWG